MTTYHHDHHVLNSSDFWLIISKKTADNEEI
jgi:hypothetical protein